MDRLWQWLWDRCGPRYSWAVFVVSVAIVLPIYALSLGFVVAYEDSDRWAAMAAVAVLAPVVSLYPAARPGRAIWRPIERWAAGDQVDRSEALEATYLLARQSIVRGLVAYGVAGCASTVAVGVLADASPGRLVQWGVVGTLTMLAVYLIATHSFVEAFLRPARAAITADSGIGDSMPRAHPSFAAWSNLCLLATAWVFTLAGATIAAVVDRTSEHPILAVVIATGMGVCFAVPITLGAAFAPSLAPLRDLATGTERVAAGDYSQPLPVVQDDDLGVLVASFNRMQSGLAERQRLQAAFGSYVDPVLATRLLEQGDDVFTGERRAVTVMFVDVRDFTPFAEAHPAEDTVALLNELFGIIVPAVVQAGGHVNKYLGDGALAVFGAPNSLDGHAAAALAAAIEIDRLVTERFQGTTRIGIGINTGQVIAGTIGGGGKLEFTLIGDTVNVAARVEQLTKVTGDTVLLTEHTLSALGGGPNGLVDRGAHELKGKAAPTQVFALA